jgi:hypothetical protein
MRFVMAATKGRWFTDRYVGSYIGFFLSMGLMGLWHGTEVHYIGYGLYHGALFRPFAWSYLGLTARTRLSCTCSDALDGITGFLLERPPARSHGIILGNDPLQFEDDIRIGECTKAEDCPEPDLGRGIAKLLDECGNCSNIAEAGQGFSGVAPNPRWHG